MNPFKFRKGVCGIFQSKSGMILMGERAHDAGQWQLPQGGLEGNETPHEALQREMFEEVGVTEVKVLKETAEWIHYEWPLGLFDSKFLGQQHIYYILDGGHLDPKTLGPTEEFARFAWYTVSEVLENIVEWKKEAYMKAFKELGLI